MKYKIGLILPGSNYFFRIGKDFPATVEAGLKKAGFDNYEIAIEPGGYNAEMKVIKEKVQSLIIKEQVDLIIAPFSPSFLVDVAGLLESNDVLLLLIHLGEDIIHKDYQSKYAFINTLGLTRAAWLQGYKTGKKYGANGASIGSLHDIGYGMARMFSLGFESSGGRFVISTFTHNKSRTESPMEPIQKVLEAKPDFLYGFYSGKEAISFTNTWFELEGEKPPFVGSYMMQADDVLEASGEKLLGQKTIGSWDRDSEEEANVEFKEFFETSLGKKAHPYGLLTYESSQLLGKALLKTGTDTPRADVLKEALSQVSITGPRGVLSFNTETQVADSEDYEFELVQEGDKLIRKNIGKAEVPDEFFEQQKFAEKNLEKDGWTNPYLLA